MYQIGSFSDSARRYGRGSVVLAMFLAACAGEGNDTPAGATPSLLAYDRGNVERQDRAVLLEQRMLEMAAAMEAQQQQLDRQARAIARLTEAGKMRGRSIAGLKKDQLAAAAKRAEDRAALETDLSALRDSIAALEARLSDMAQDIAAASDTATLASLTVNRGTAESMAADGDPVAGTIAPGQSYGLHLASYRSEDAARDGWREMRAAHDDVLGNLDMRLKSFNLESLGGRYLRLVAGPFIAVESAREACARLRPREQFCQVTVYREDSRASAGE